LHPKIIDMLAEHGLSTWCGYRYWMSFSPFPKHHGNRYEDPCVVCSNDRTTWVAPTGITNPIDNAPGAYPDENIGTRIIFNADPELVYDADNDRLILFWIRTDYVMADNGSGVGVEPTSGVTAHLFYATLDGESYPYIGQPTLTNPNVQDGTYPTGTHYNDAALLSYNGVAPACICPMVAQAPDGTWHMWMTVMPSLAAGVYMLAHRQSSDPLSWSSGYTLCNDPFDDVFFAGFYPWHGGVKYNPWEERFEFIVSLSDNPDHADDMHMAYVQCPVDTPTALVAPFTGWVLDPDTGVTWEDRGPYRATFIIERQTTGYFYQVWYSALGTVSDNIGYAEGALPTGFSDFYDVTFDLCSVAEALAGQGTLVLTAQGTLAMAAPMGGTGLLELVAIGRQAGSNPLSGVGALGVSGAGRLTGYGTLGGIGWLFLAGAGQQAGGNPAAGIGALSISGAGSGTETNPFGGVGGLDLSGAGEMFARGLREVYREHMADGDLIITVPESGQETFEFEPDGSRTWRS
jgi:hypothetical protein